ncbi:MAG: leucine-rich repeat domain-containing protein [Sphaerochaetaceae bacterium]|nr:leucine-rich repeat domain-containing protein [Sphaerochaetaceae bacterium]
MNRKLPEIIILLSLCLICSCAEVQEDLGRANLRMLEAKAGTVYRFTAVRGEETLVPSASWQEANGSSISAGSFSPGIWTFGVCGFDSNNNVVEFGQATVFLKCGQEVDVDITIYPYIGEGSASVTFNAVTVAAEGTHYATLILSKDGADTQLALSGSSDGSKKTLSKTITLDSGVYTVKTIFTLDGSCYYTDVSVLRVLPDSSVTHRCEAQITPSYIDIDFTDLRFDYNLVDNPSKICTGFRDIETGEEVDLSQSFYSPMGPFWTSASDLGLEPILKDATAENYLNAKYVAIGSEVALSAGLFGNTSSAHNTKLKAVVCYANFVPNYTFAYCDELEKVCIDMGTTCLNRYVFAYCQKLRFVSFASSVTDLRTGCFSNCDYSILYVYVPFPPGTRPTDWASTWGIVLNADHIIYDYYERST